MCTMLCTVLCTGSGTITVLLIQKDQQKVICSYTDKTYIALSCNLHFKVVNMVKSFDSLLYLLMFHVLNSL